MAITKRTEFIQSLNKDLNFYRDNFYKENGTFRGWKKSKDGSKLLDLKSKSINIYDNASTRTKEAKETYKDIQGSLRGFKNSDIFRKVTGINNGVFKRAKQRRTIEQATTGKIFDFDKYTEIASGRVFHGVLSYGNNVVKSIQQEFTDAQETGKEVLVYIDNKLIEKQSAITDVLDFDLKIAELYEELTKHQDRAKGDYPLLDAHRTENETQVFINLTAYKPANPLI